MRVGRKIALRHRAHIGEIAAPPAGDQDLLAGLVRMVDQQHPPPALPCHRRAHQPGPAGAEDDRIERGGFWHWPAMASCCGLANCRRRWTASKPGPAIVGYM